MEYINSTSSQVKKFGYDEPKHDLHVHFVSGGHYVYEDVSPEEFEAFSSAPSHGRHLNQEIKPNKIFRRIS